MKTTSFLLCTLLLYAAPTLGQEVDETQVCQGECDLLLQAGIEWLLDSLSYSRDAVVLDTAGSGFRGAGAAEVRVLGTAIFDRVARRLDVQRESRFETISCAETRDESDCELTVGRILMTVYPPQLVQGSAQISFRVALLGHLERSVTWGLRIYEVVLQKHLGTWRVMEGRLVGMS